MNNVVSSKTAKRLKAAGFPQGGRKEGIAIYAPTGDKYLIGEDVGSGYSIVDGWTVCSPSSIEGTDIFAPSVTDILKELGESFALRIDGKGLWLCLKEMETENDTDGRSFIYYEIKANNKNPAEACAAAWLFVNEKTATQ